MTDKIAVLEPLDEGNTLIRGTGFGSLGQFGWCALVPSGAVIPDDKLPTARQALTAMGYRIVDPASTRATPAPPRGHTGPDHMRYVSDADDLTVLPDNAPGGHWQDESSTCPRCNPAHAEAAATVRAEAMATINATLARIAANSDRVGHPEHAYRGRTRHGAAKHETPQQLAARMSAEYRRNNPDLFTAAPTEDGQ